jgi:aminoglycoside/choline kinase family phosphotransferase
MATNRDSQIDAFLAGTKWAGAARKPLAGDASTRSYQRLDAQGDVPAAVLMNADPDLGNDVGPFVQLTGVLRALGLSAPEIFAQDAARGFLILEDLGDDLFARVVATDPSLEKPLYFAATDVLIDLHNAQQPKLPPYDTALMTQMAGLAYDWYQLGCLDAVDADAKAAFCDAFSRFLDTAVAAPSVLIQRDYHAENLLWLPDRDSSARVGLLDYQDALLGHPAYDLVSLLKDARRDVSRDVEVATVSYYAKEANVDVAEFEAAYFVLGLQRNLRILGVFARLSMHYGKPNYVDLIPRVWGHVLDCLGHPSCQDISDLVLQSLPAPTPEYLQRIKDKCATLPLQ